MPQRRRKPSRPRAARRALAPALLVAGTLVLAVPACSPGEPGVPDGGAPRPRNAILISIDTLRADHLSCYGYPRATSPHLDELARAGVRFADVTAAAPWTLPSHATMLTGLYPSRHGVMSHQTRLPDAVVTLAEEFQAGGFETFAVVNTHNLGAPQYQLAQGFGRFRYISETDEDQRSMRLRTLNMGDVVVGQAKEFLGARDPSRPFFLFLHFYDVHTDFTPHEEYRRQFVQPYEGKLDGRTQQLNGVRNRGERLGEADVRFLREMYDAEIRTLDELLGRFVAWLREQELFADCLLVITSDHGEEFQEHGGVLHGRTQYQELLRVPLIVAGPGVPGGAVIETPVHGVDVTPTLLGVMGVPTRAARDGLDLSVAWRGGTLPERLLFGEADQDNRQAGQQQVDTRRMVRRGADKLIHDRVSQRSELYDLARDPLEQRDLARERDGLARELVAELERFRAGPVPSEAVPPPSAEEQRKLDAMGYGGHGDGE